MKLTDIRLEARHQAYSGDLERLIMAALDELGIKLKFGRVIDWHDGLVQQAVGMMKDAKGDPSKGAYSSVIFGLSDAAEGLKKLPDTALDNFVRGMSKLQSLPHFMHQDMNIQYQRQAIAMDNAKRQMLPVVEHLLHICQAILEIRNVASSTSDDYKKSVATAVIKKLGLAVED